jgi:hypothetical protein
VRLIARLFLNEFKRGHDASEFKLMVDEWYCGPSVVESRVPPHIFDWFAYYFDGMHTLPGEAIERAMLAVDDASLSEGLPPEILNDHDANLLARMFRWLSRYHGGKPFYLSQARMKQALGRAKR